MDSTTLRADSMRRAGIDRQAARIAVRAQLREDGVRQPLPLADVLEQARAHAAAQQGVEHVTGEALLVRQRIRRHAQAQMHLFQRLLVAQGDAGVRGGNLYPRAALATGQLVEMLAHQFHQWRSCVRLPAAVTSRLEGA
jgi:hypothetical protein